MGKKVLVDLDFDNVAKIIGLLPATDGTGAVNLDQLNAAIEGLNWKDSVRAASTGRSWVMCGSSSLSK